MGNKEEELRREGKGKKRKWKRTGGNGKKEGNVMNREKGGTSGRISGAQGKFSMLSKFGNVLLSSDDKCFCFKYCNIAKYPFS